ncbi:Uncharacterised protein [uncultured Blautia sp.]|nr:Uncharacterised protein [uncultured Blautia sp.]
MSPRACGPSWSKRPHRATPWPPRPTASMSASPTGTGSTPSLPKTRSCRASRSSRPRLPMALLWKTPSTPSRVSLAPSAPLSPPGRMALPWWRTSPLAFISSVRNPFRSHLFAPPVSRPSPCGPAKSPRHGLRTTPGPASKSSRKILPTAPPSRGSPTRSGRSTGISWTRWSRTARARRSWR